MNRPEFENPTFYFASLLGRFLSAWGRAARSKGIRLGRNRTGGCVSHCSCSKKGGGIGQSCSCRVLLIGCEPVISVFVAFLGWSRLVNRVMRLCNCVLCPLNCVLCFKIIS